MKVNTIHFLVEVEATIFRKGQIVSNAEVNDYCWYEWKDAHGSWESEPLLDDHCPGYFAVAQDIAFGFRFTAVSDICSSVCQHPGGPMDWMREGSSDQELFADWGDILKEEVVKKLKSCKLPDQIQVVRLLTKWKYAGERSPYPDNYGEYDDWIEFVGITTTNRLLEEMRADT